MNTTLFLALFGLAAGGYQDQEAAMLLTRARADVVRTGKCIKHLPNVLISQHKQWESIGKSLFIMDSERLDDSFLVAKFSKLGSKEFLDKLGQFTGTSFPAEFDLHGGDFKWEKGLSTVKSWFIIPSTPNIAEESMVSYRVYLGTRDGIKALKDDICSESRQAALYASHFSNLPLEIEITKERPGRPEANVAVVNGIYLVKHMARGAGRIVIPTPAEGLDEKNVAAAPSADFLVAENVKQETLGKANEFTCWNFRVNARSFIDRLLVPAIYEEGATPPKLECDIPSEGNDSSCYPDQNATSSTKEPLVWGQRLCDSPDNKNEAEFWIHDPNRITTSYRISLHPWKEAIEAPAPIAADAH